MKRVMTVSVISVLVFLMSFAGAGEKKLLPSGTHIIKTDGGMDLALTIPAGFSLDKGNSLIVLLHGAQMQDLNDVKSVWSGWTDSFSRSGYIVVVPRSKTNPNAWDAKDIDDLAKFCKKIADDYNVLNRQGVAVGHSSGADGAARLVTTEPRLFSAIVSLGGQTRPETATLKNNNIGVFLFHFNGDNVVNISFAKQLEENLKKAGVNVTLKTEDMNSHAIEHYAQRALSPTTSWLSNWMKDEARKLTSVGQDNNLNWQVLSDTDPRETAKNDHKPFIIYAYSQKDKEHKGIQWCEWDLFPHEEFKKEAGEFNCYKLDLENAKEMAKKLSISSCGLYIYDSKGKQVKKLDKPTSIEKLLKDMEKLVPPPPKK